MSRKKICVYMGELILDFQRELCEELMEQSKSKNMDIHVFASFGSYIGPYGRNMFFELGEKNICHLPDFSKYDAMIICPDTFDIYNMDLELYERIKAEATCPVISIRSGSPDFPVISADNKTATKAITNHFIREHGFTRLCYMSGPLDFKDGAARYSGFCEAMAEAGLLIKPNTHFEGDYWKDKGELAVSRFYDCPPEEYPQAIICGNDYMAISVMEAVQNRGLRVPEDVCIAGFDDTPDSRTTTPPLTTIKIQPKEFIKIAIKSFEEAWEGKEIPMLQYVNHEILLRDSCGCGKFEKTINTFEMLKTLNRYDALLRATSRITSDYQNCFTVENALTIANYHFPIMDCNRGYLCLCDNSDEAYNSIEEMQIYSKNMYLRLQMDKHNIDNSKKFNLKFDRSEILPKEVIEDKPHFFVVFQIHYRTSTYGYMVLEPEKNEWPNIFIINFLNTIAYAIESSLMEEQFKELSEIKNQYLIDPLTEVYNRRGFEKKIQQILTDNITYKNTLIDIISIDMDNLKTINDQYGHAEGDFAIISVINTIKDCLGENDFCARIGGDEFIVLLMIEDHRNLKEFIEQVNKGIYKKSIEIAKPYTLHVSMGDCGPTLVPDVTLYNCMQIADQNMYKNKREYKMTLKKKSER